MSLYIKYENQGLLWNTIQKNEYFMQAFPTQAIRENWFRGIIAKFHILNPSIVSQEGLKKNNQDTIKYMIVDLKQRIKTALIPPAPAAAPVPIVKPKVTFDDRSSEYSRNKPSHTGNSFVTSFVTLKEDYESMFKKPEPPKDVTFTEKMEDQVIKNMDELIQEQIKLRELDLPNYPVLPAKEVENIELNAIEIETPIEIKPNNTLESRIETLEKIVAKLEALISDKISI